MMVPPPPRQSDQPMMLAIAFRPIVARETVQAPAVLERTDSMRAES
jgi:hypothetical protein